MNFSIPAGRWQDLKHLVRRCRRSLFGATVLGLYMTGPSFGAAITGNIDGINASNIGGWACVAGQNQAVSIAIYAGNTLVGIYPTTVQRNDLGNTCGSAPGTYGFSIALSPNIVQQLYGKSNISVQAVEDGFTPLLLPPTSSNPYPIPGGSISSAISSGTVTGVVSGTGSAPPVPVLAGGPRNGGGTRIGYATTTSIGNNNYSFSLTSATISSDLNGAPVGYNLPITAYALDQASAPVPLSNPLPVGPAAAFYQVTPSNQAVQQSGSQSGITNTIFTTWISTNSVFTGISGTFTLSGNDASFSEALVVFGSAPTLNTQATCQQANNTSPSQVPGILRTGAVILKDVTAYPGSGTTNVMSVPFNFALPYGMPLSGSSGSCLITLLSAGYPYLNSQTAKYSDTTAGVTETLSAAVAGAPNTFPVGIGNEFQFGTSSSSSQFTIVAIKVVNAAQLDAIAASASVAGVVGAPSGSAWLPLPTGNWTATTSFYQFTAADCAALPVTFGTPNSFYASAVLKTPTTYTVPSDAVLLGSLPLASVDSTPAQQTSFMSFSSATQLGSSTVSLTANECVVALHNVSSPTNALDGVLDFENQSTAYFHSSP